MVSKEKRPEDIEQLVAEVERPYAKKWARTSRRKRLRSL